MSQAALVAMLEEARELLADPGNDFLYSRWADEKAAVADIDAILTTIARGGTIRVADLELLFAPTGSIQEVAMSSGWDDAFMGLSTRFDAAIRDL